MKQYTLHAPRADAQSINFEGALNQEQYAVVSAGDGQHLVIAGAGSGKTRTLTYRVARLVQDGVSPDRILLCTFTNKAAREMVHRVEQLLRHSTDTMWAGTFHHIANRILRQHAKKLGFTNDFTILDREDSSQLINEAIQRSGVLEGGMRFPKGRALTSLFGLCRSTQRRLSHVIADKFPKFEEITGEIDEVWQAYQERKVELNMMDFDDLLHYWLQLFQEFPEVQEDYAKHFQHVLVDEYQDTNPLQSQLIDRISSHHKNLTVVGDDAQSIYSFRGADCRNILEFPDRYPESKTFYLRNNYRSRPEILHTSNRVIEYNTYQFPKELIATRPPGIKPAMVIAKNARQEADFIVQHIKELVEEGVPLDEIAILYRIHSHSVELQLALQHHNIPFVIRSGIRFFEKAHIKDMLAFLRILHNGRDELSWRRILPLLPGVGPASINAFWDKLEHAHFDFEALQQDGALNNIRKKARRSVEWLLRLREEALELDGDPSSALQLFFEQEYQDHLQHAYDNANMRAEEIETLSTFAKEYESIRNFLDEMTLLDEMNAKAQQETSPDEYTPSVVLSTVHQAKGLEWKAVFLLDLAERSFPFFFAGEENNAEEERRLFYVANTRAKDHLYLLFRSTYPHKKWGWRNSKPSRFLWEILYPLEAQHTPAENNLKELLESSNGHDAIDTWLLDENARLNIDDF